MKKLNKALNMFEDGLIAILLFSATVLLFVNVILRKYFNSSTTWAEEAIRYAMIWITFIGGSVCARNYLHVGIDLVAENSSPKIKKILNAIAELSSAVFSFILAYFGYENTRLVLETSQLSPALRMPMWLIYISIPIGCTIMGIRFIVNFWKTINDKSDKDDTPDFRTL